MSFLSGNTGNLPAPSQRPLGLEPRKLSTNEQARPVPLLYGRDRVGVTFLSEAFSARATEVTQDVPKKSEDVVTGYNYYCSFVGLVCHGPVDAIEAIYFDGQKVWPTESPTGIARDGANPVFCDITINDFGTWKFYWGTESQGVDSTLATLAALPTPIKHPAYKGMCYFVAIDQFLGYQSNKVQVIEVEVTRYLGTHFGAQGTYTAWLSGQQIGTDLNPMAAAVDTMVNSRYGLGLRDVSSGDTMLDRTLIQDSASRLSGELLGVSRVIDRMQSVDQVMVTLMETVDAYWLTSPGGMIGFGLNRSPAAGATLPELDELAIIGEPSLSNPTWSSVATDVAVKFVNAMNEFTDDVAHASNAVALRRVGEPNPESLDRAWIRNPNTAAQLAHIMAKVLGLPRVTGSVTVRKSRLQGIAPGGRFLLHWDHWDLCNLPCIATAITVQDAFKPAVEIEWELDRAALSKATYVAAAYVAPERMIYDAPDITAFRPIELPYLRNAGTQEAVRVGFVMQRPDSMATSWRASQLQPSGTSYKGSITGGLWAYHGTLASDYSATATGQIQLTVAAPDVIASLPSLGSSDAAKDPWILLVVKSDGLDEMMAVHSKDTSGSPVLKYSVLRERFDTRRRDHLAGDEWFLFPYSLFGQAAQPTGVVLGGEVLTFKAQSIVLGRQSEFASATPTSLTIQQRTRRPWKPKGVTCSTTYNDSTTVTLNWTPQHRDGDDAKGGVMPGVEWVIEFRRASDDPASVARTTIIKRYDDASAEILGSVLEAALGAPVSAKALIFARSGDYRSLHADEFTITRV